VFEHLGGAKLAATFETEDLGELFVPKILDFGDAKLFLGDLEVETAGEVSNIGDFRGPGDLKGDLMDAIGDFFSTLI
jgi:hypothetical protein